MLLRKITVLITDNITLEKLHHYHEKYMREKERQRVRDRDKRQKGTERKKEIGREREGGYIKEDR